VPPVQKKWNAITTYFLDEVISFVKTYWYMASHYHYC